MRADFTLVEANSTLRFPARRNRSIWRRCVRLDASTGSICRIRAWNSRTRSQKQVRSALEQGLSLQIMLAAGMDCKIGADLKRMTGELLGSTKTLILGGR